MPIAARWRQVESDVIHAIELAFSMLFVLSVVESRAVSITALKSDRRSSEHGKIEFVRSRWTRVIQSDFIY